MKRKECQSIGWMDGRWGSLNELSVPLKDRSLQLADGIFETILVLDGKPQLLKEHLKRFKDTASLLRMEAPPETKWIKMLIREAIKKIKLFNGHGAVRINWSRGNQTSRGINLPLPL